MPLPTGSRLGTYEIVGPLGAGGMGEVYRARDLRLGRAVALKVLPAGVAGHPERLERFEREARTVAGLNHPNIVVLYSVEDDGDTRFLTMELVEGEGLDHAVAPGGLALARVVDIGVALADALTAAHEQGVVHRDLKPANVMLTRDGRVKVLDFGLAKLEREGSASDATQALTTPLSAVGQVLGTVPYMAPEQVRGEAVDARADLFALGAVLYELATGRRAFAGATSADVGSAILRDAPPPLAAARPELPPDLVRVVERCLEKQPRARFQTALDVGNELRRVRQQLDRSQAPDAARDDVASIAVLPFVNRSRDEDDEYFADGLADELLGTLARIRGLRVAARSSSSSFKGRAVTVAEVGAALNVATVLEGTVRKAGNRLRVSVQLVKVADGFHLWSDTYDRTLEDIFAVQDDIAQCVVKELRTALLGEAAGSSASGQVRAEIAQAGRGRGTDPEAHRLFLQARFFTNRTTDADAARGIELLQRAAEIEPGNARVWAALSWALMSQGMFGMSDVEPSTEHARRHALHALELEPDLADAHAALASIQLMHDFDWAGAERSIARALALAPGDPEVLRTAGMVEYVMNRPERSLELCLRSVEQDPLNGFAYSFLGRAQRIVGRLDDAEASFRRALELAPDYSNGHCLLAWTLAAQGRLDEALAEARREQPTWARLSGLSTVHATRGELAESEAALQELIAHSADRSAWQIACACSERGDADGAFEWLERAYVQRDSGLPMVVISPFFVRLRDDPRWPGFLRRIGREDAIAR